MTADFTLLGLALAIGFIEIDDRNVDTVPLSRMLGSITT